MKWYKNFVVFWTVIYLSIAFLGRFTSPDKEYFPFFRWSLYSKTPNILESPSIFMLKYNDETFTTPVNILELTSKHKISPTDMNLNVVNFYKELISTKNANGYDHLKSTSLVKSLPNGCEFKLVLNTMDLSKKKWRDQTKTIELLEYKNNKFYGFN